MYKGVVALRFVHVRSLGCVIIIIIIKKVKIIVTLSIKNTAGALYKSVS